MKTGRVFSGDIWIGAQGGGLYKYSAGNFTHDPPERGFYWNITALDEARETARSAGACEYVVKENLIEIRRILAAHTCPEWANAHSLARQFIQP